MTRAKQSLDLRLEETNRKQTSELSVTVTQKNPNLLP